MRLSAVFTFSLATLAAASPILDESLSQDSLEVEKRGRYYEDRYDYDLYYNRRPGRHPPKKPSRPAQPTISWSKFNNGTTTTTPATTVTKPTTSSTKTTVSPTKTPSPVFPDYPGVDDLIQVFELIEDLYKRLFENIFQAGFGSIFGDSYNPFGFKREEIPQDVNITDFEELLGDFVTNVFSGLVSLTNNTNISLAHSFLEALDL